MPLPPPNPPTFDTVRMLLRLERPGHPGCGSPNRAMRDMLERAHWYITDLGHSVTACHVDKRAHVDEAGHDVRVYKIHVYGVPCFEVIVDTSPWRDYEATEVTTARVIAWPQARQS